MYFDKVEQRYSKGDKVVIVDERADRMNVSGLMDKYLGTIMTIAQDDITFGGSRYYSMEEDEGTWYWYDSMINHEATATLQHNMQTAEALCDRLLKLNPCLEVEEEEEVDMVNHPAHYTTGNIEVIDFIEDKRLGYHLGNVVKYVARNEFKGKAIEDLKKARWYLDRKIEKMEEDAE